MIAGKVEAKNLMQSSVFTMIKAILQSVVILFLTAFTISVPTSCSIAAENPEIQFYQGNRMLMIAASDNVSSNSDDSEDDLYGEEYVRTPEKQVADPLYWFNYAMYTFNDRLYFWVLKPVAKGYNFITPDKLRVGLRNFFYNALFPIRFVNNLLQGKGTNAVDEVKSFVLNTVGGGLGFATPAKDIFGIDTHKEDLGQTFGKYSVKEGFYLVLPLLGPSTARDAIGSVGDFFLTPTTYIESTELAIGVSALDTVNETSFRLGDYEALKSAALDPYVSLKDAYIQMRKKRIQE